MSVLGAMYSGISGLNANAVAMEIIGNNIANLNTPGFKGSRPEFGDILSRTISGSISIGRGSQLEASVRVFSQGGLQTTDNVTDLALESAGFFMVRDQNSDGDYYTRAGNFRLDAQGFMTTATGFRVQGFAVDDAGEYIGTPQDIQINNAPLAPRQTGDGTAGTGVSVYLNLSADGSVNPGGPAFNVADPVTTSNFVNSITVYDSLGNAHQISVYYRRVSETPSQWEWHAVVPAADATSGVDTIAASGMLEFDTSGALASETVTAPPDFDFAGGPAQNQNIGFDFGESIADGGTGFTGTTQFGEASAVVFQGQDGYGPSYLVSIDVSPDGQITGRYGNGESVVFGRLAVARFAVQEQLTQVGGNLFAETQRSGSPTIGVPNEGGIGRVFSNTLELSNVDMAAQFVQMITTQRGYQANSRSITTVDEMVSELLTLKR